MGHLNMLKFYVKGESGLAAARPSAVVASSVADDIVNQDFSVPCGRLMNSVMLNVLDFHLSHLTPNQMKDIVEIIKNHRSDDFVTLCHRLQYLSMTSMLGMHDP